MIDLETVFTPDTAKTYLFPINLDFSPIDIAKAMVDSDYFIFLDSSSIGAQGRYSILAWNPSLVFKSKGSNIDLRYKDKWIKTAGNPFAIVDMIQCASKVPRQENQPMPFFGGAVGYLGYDLFPFVEDYKNLTAIDDLMLPDCCLGFYDIALVFDHDKNQWFVSGTTVFGDFEKPETRSEKLLEQVFAKLKNVEGDKNSKTLDLNTNKDIGLTSNFTKEDYLASVKKAIDYIYAGDIYQINLSQRFHARIQASPFDLFCQLRRINPSYYGAYMSYGDHVVISSSPELFIQREGDIIESRPIKGTRPRGQTKESDENLKAELENSIKDSAELSMIVDLMRNDLGRVCEYGSVVVDEHRYIETLPTVFHTISTVRGKLKENISIAEILRATFPGGSITGCPKIRSIEIIDELEPTKRNVYTGSVGYIGFNGDMVLNIAIRTLIVKNGNVYFQVGGGIVADSDPEAEYLETLDKALAMERALEAVKNGVKK